MTFSATDICSHALVKLGAGTISSFSENTTGARIAEQLYTPTTDALLASYPWRFALAQSTLARLADTPASDYRYAYALPADCLRVLSAGTGTHSRGLNYRLTGDQLHTDAEQVLLTYISRPAERQFPAFFTQALTAQLAAEFCLPLTESTTRTDYLRKIATETIQQARLADSQQSVPSSFQDFSLIEVRQ